MKNDHRIFLPLLSMNPERRAPSRPVPEACLQRAEAVLGSPITWFRVLLRAHDWRSELSMSLVAADVRRLILIWAKEVSASLRRLLPFRGSLHNLFQEILAPLGWGEGFVPNLS